jgi:hypothetical protein
MAVSLACLATWGGTYMIPCRTAPAPAWRSYENPYQARTAAAIFERLFSADAHSPGATAISAFPTSTALAGAYHDCSGLRLPVIRATYDQQPNEQRMLACMEERAVEPAAG